MNTELMLKVRARILAEPRRVDMGEWINRRWFCRTTACIAGHTIECYGGRVPKEDIEVDEDLCLTPGDIAGKLLGLPDMEADWLFRCHWLGDEGSPYNDIGIRLAILKPGSKQYAQVVAEAIDICIARNTKQGTPLEPTDAEVVALMAELAEEYSE
jgi:hypothetical protein